MIKICKRFTFEAAHRLPTHKGKCSRPHGHSYMLDVEVSGDLVLTGENVDRGSSSHGMVCDFAILKKIVTERILDRFDHKDLNAEIPKLMVEKGWYWSTLMDAEKVNLTTAEVMVRLFAQDLEFALYHLNFLPGVYLTRVRLYETAGCYAEWTRE